MVLAFKLVHIYVTLDLPPTPMSTWIQTLGVQKRPDRNQRATNVDEGVAIVDNPDTNKRNV
jgi:hypothetical protein